MVMSFPKTGLLWARHPWGLIRWLRRRGRRLFSHQWFDHGGYSNYCRAGCFCKVPINLSRYFSPLRWWSWHFLSHLKKKNNNNLFIEEIASVDEVQLICGCHFFLPTWWKRLKLYKEGFFFFYPRFKNFGT